jgi:hypothetical protein
MAQSQEFLKREFVHQVSNLIALLGADEQLVRKFHEIEEKPFTADIIQELMRYNSAEVDRVKTRLSLQHTYPIQPQG